MSAAEDAQCRVIIKLIVFGKVQNLSISQNESDTFSLTRWEKQGQVTGKNIQHTGYCLSLAFVFLLTDCLVVNSSVLNWTASIPLCKYDEFY